MQIATPIDIHWDGNSHCSIKAIKARRVNPAPAKKSRKGRIDPSDHDHLVIWIEEEVTHFCSSETYDVWHDRPSSISSRMRKIEADMSEL